MLENIFMQILNMSITAATMVLVVILLRFLLKPMPKLYSYVLWSVVLFRLVCPFSFTTDYSLLGMMNVKTVEQGRIEYISADALNMSAEMETEKNGVKGKTEETVIFEEIQESRNTSFTDFDVKRLIKMGSMIWFFGIIFLIGSNIRKLILLQKCLKTAVWEKENIYYSKITQTPFTIGIWKPKIILPLGLREEEKEYILLHEQIHIQRKDHIIKLVSFVLLCIHWFNPLIWTAFFLSEKDMEMSCDEAVVRKLGNHVKKEYSMSLLSLASGQRIFSGALVLFGEGDTKERIKNVLNFKEPKKFAGIIAVSICVMAGVFLLANPSKEKSENNTVKTENTEIENISGQKEELKEQDIQNMDMQKENVDNDNVEEGKNLIIDNIYMINVRSISRSARCIDRYTIPDEGQMKEMGLESAYNEETGMIEEPLAFAQDCVFKTNFSMNTVVYEEVSFDTFADFIGSGDANRNKPCMVVLEDGLITQIILKSAYWNFGIYFSEKIKYDDYADMVEIVKEMEGSDTNMLEKYYKLVYSSLADSSKKWDVVEHSTHEERKSAVMNRTEESSEEGRKNNRSYIEVYTGNIGDGDSGYVFVKNADGKILHSEFAHIARAGWNNIYLGSIEGSDYLMTFHHEDRDDFGGYSYEVFRVDENGEIMQIAGSSFEWGGTYTYDDELFRQWVEGLEYYMENSRLILSSQEGEVHTKAKSEEVYNYETLRRR